MFKIYDGREKFYQWDIDRQLIVEDPSITEVHFTNRATNDAYVCETYVEDGKTLVNVPNILLQTNWRIQAYAYDGKHTKHDVCYEVVSRSKPNDYVYTETELKDYSELENRIDEIEKNGISDEAVAAAVETYLEENDIQVDLTGYATEAYVDEAIANAEIDVNLTDYYTKKETDNLIEAIELTPGEKGEPGEPGKDGKDGKKGADGISATHSWYGTTLSITSASGTSSADLQGAPGTPGKNGKDGYTPVRGVDYWTAEDKAEIIAEAASGGEIDLSGYATDAELAAVDTKVTNLTATVGTKANSADVYTKSQVYNKTEVDNKIANTGGTTVIAAERVDIYCDAEAEGSGSNLDTALGLRKIYDAMENGKLPDISNYYINGCSIIEGNVFVNENNKTYLKLYVIDAPNKVKCITYPVVSGSSTDFNSYRVSSYAVGGEIPTKLSELTNDTGYATENYVANNYVPLTGGVLTGTLDATKYYINGVSFSAADKVNNTLSIGSSTYSTRVTSKDKPQWFKDGKAQGTFAMVSDIPNLENYATKTYVDEVLGVIENGTY